MNRVVYFESPVDNLDRAASFCEAVFECTLERGSVDGNTMAFFPDDVDVAGASGALVQGESYRPSLRGARIYFATHGLDAILARVDQSWRTDDLSRDGEGRPWTSRGVRGQRGQLCRAARPVPLWASNQAESDKRNAQQSADAIERLGSPRRIGYGSTDAEQCDLNLTKRPNAVGSWGMRRAHLEGVRVCGRHRGLGIGGRLMIDAVARARAAGCGLVQRTSDATRTDARRFYARLGFEATHVGMKLSLPTD